MPEPTLKRYPGGKNAPGIYQRIINLMPPHQTYIEMFLGTGAVMARKRPALRNIGIDLNPECIENAKQHIIPKIQQQAPRAFNSMLQTNSITWLKNYLTGPRHEMSSTVIYADPPYVHSTRRQCDLYKFELSDQDHEELLRAMVSARNSLATCLISGYRCELYDEWLYEWNRIDYVTMTRRGPVTESLWYSHRAPLRLHDYSHLGTGFRQRQDIKRKIARWTKKLASMDNLEAHAIYAALEATLEHRR